MRARYTVSTCCGDFVKVVTIAVSADEAGEATFDGEIDFNDHTLCHKALDAAGLAGLPPCGSCYDSPFHARFRDVLDHADCND
jgi:hypothetical protein